MTATRYGDVSVALENHIALVEIHRPPHNHFDHALVRDLADAFRDLDAEPQCRALMLASEGKAFCAGANYNPSSGSTVAANPDAESLYAEAVRLFSSEKPVIAAIQGPAIGGGLGLSLVADFRVVAPEARFAANFVSLGFHPGFGLTYTLPRVIGIQRASLMFYTGRRIKGDEAVAWGLGDVLAPADELRQAARNLATEIAICAPLAVRSTRATMRKGLASAVREQLRHELAEQNRLRQTEDFQEGVRAVRERRPGQFVGR
jgi:enoyl-CoA hydratase/carnithine racemase